MKDPISLDEMVSYTPFFIEREEIAIVHNHPGDQSVRLWTTTGADFSALGGLTTNEPTINDGSFIAVDGRFTIRNETLSGLLLVNTKTIVKLWHYPEGRSQLHLRGGYNVDAARVTLNY